MQRLHIALAALFASHALFAAGSVVAQDLLPIIEEPEDVHGHDAGRGHDIHTIVITGSPLEHERDELAVAVDRLDRDEILDSLGATLGETLGTRPGIATSGFSGGASRPVIRGQDAYRTEVTEDGLPTQDASRESPDHAVPVNPLAIERVEVVRGPATLRYGGGASAGVVNAITKRVPDQLPGDRVEGGVFGAIDSAADRRDLSAVLDGGLGPVAWHADALLRRADDYEIPSGGTQNGTFVDAFAASAGASWFVGTTARIGAAYSRFESNYGIPEDDENAEIDMTTNRALFEGDWYGPFPGARTLRLRGAYTDYQHDEKVDGAVGQTFDNDQFDGRLELLHAPFWEFRGAVGMTGRYRDLVSRGEAEEFLAPSRTTSGALYVFEERALHEELVGEFGLRVEATRVEGTPFGSDDRRRRSFLPVSGSAGLVATPWDGWTFGLVGAASQRAPAEVELFARGPHEATGTFEIGNPDFDEETSYTGEIRMTFDRDSFRVEAAGFATYYDDYIFAQLTGTTVDESGDPTLPADPDALDLLRYRNRNAWFAGGEILVRAILWDGFGGSFGIDGQFDYVRARFTGGSDRNVPRIPPIRWGGNLFYEGDWLRARVGFLRTEEQNAVSDFENPTDDFTFLNASLTLSLEPLYDRVPVELTVQGANLTDKKGRNVVSFKVDEVVLPGRNIRGSLRVTF